MRRPTVLMGEARRRMIILTILEGSCRWHGSLEGKEEISGYDRAIAVNPEPFHFYHMFAHAYPSTIRAESVKLR